MPRHRVGAKRRPMTGSGAGIQYAVSSVCFTIGAAAYWIARSSRAMTGVGRYIPTRQFVAAAIGSMPLLTISPRAAGEPRNLISALPASGSFETLAMPAENTVIFCSSSGSGPTMSMPSTGFNSLTC